MSQPYVFSVAPSAVLFDLDGTLIDSAPDLAAAVNYLRAQRGLEELSLSRLRPYASLGAPGLIGAGLGITPEHPEFDGLRNIFLDYYEAHSTVLTRVFAGMDLVLDWLDHKNIPWGIITNKHTRFTQPILKALALDERASVVVSGDTTSHAKPHPAPMLYAAKQLDMQTSQLVYVGDDVRDIQAAHAAQFMGALAAHYGYCQPDEINSWQADAILYRPEDLMGLLNQL